MEEIEGYRWDRRQALNEVLGWMGPRDREGKASECDGAETQSEHYKSIREGKTYYKGYELTGRREHSEGVRGRKRVGEGGTRKDSGDFIGRASLIRRLGAIFELKRQ